MLDHSLTCSGFIFKEKKSKRKIDKQAIEKLNIPFDKLNGIRNGADWINSNGHIIKNKDITSPNSLSHTYAFCTDTRYNEDLIDKINGVDLLYHEATFKKDLSERAKETGHSTTFEASEIARKANVKKLIIGHFSQRYKNVDELLVEVKENFRNSILAEPGLTIEFKTLDS